MDKPYKINGYMYFRYEGKNEELGVITRKLAYYENSEKAIYDLIDGKDFVKMIKDGSIIDYDGTLANVFVDGYNSNLGLFGIDKQADFSQGGFTVSPEVWEKLCEEYKIEVNWANK